MIKYTVRVLALAALLGGCASSAFAQATAPQPPAATQGPTICGATGPLPANLPPAGSGPVLWLIAPCFPTQGNAYTVEPQTYLFYMELAKQVSQPSQNRWTPWTEELGRTAVPDHSRLSSAGLLSYLSTDAHDYTFPNAVIGKLVTTNMQGRECLKIVNYEGITPIGDRANAGDQPRARSIEM